MIQFCRIVFLGTLFLLVGAALPAFAAPAPGGGGTTVTVDGTTVTITVHLELCCLQDASERDVWTPLVLADVKAAQDLWNNALADLPAKGCYDLKVVFDARLLNKGDPWDPGYHEISMNFSQRGVSYSNDFWASAGTSDDDTAYISTTTGTFFVAEIDPLTWAHEIGHLMGLGDDYTKDGCLRGRRDTLMCAGKTIDQQLADRLADILNSDGLLPQCWKGTLTGHGQGNIYNDTALVKFAFTVAADKSVTGKADAKVTPARQAFSECYFTRKPTPDEMDVTLRGRREGDEFKLKLQNPAVMTQITQDCPGGLGGGNGAHALPMALYGCLAMDPNFTSPQVRATDGGTNSTHFKNPIIDSTATIEVHETSKTPTPRDMQSDNSENLQYLR
jgi:hypothetical protein